MKASLTLTDIAAVKLGPLETAVITAKDLANNDVEIVISSTAIRFDWTSAQGTTNFASPITAFSTSSDHNWYGTLNGRLGYVQGAWLYYVKGGDAWMNADYRLVVNSGLGGAASMSPNRNGWTIGAGAEYMLSPRWSAKLEYSYLDFGRNTYGFAIPGAGAGLSFNTQVHEVKVGANYHWAPGTL